MVRMVQMDREDLLAFKDLVVLEVKTVFQIELAKADAVTVGGARRLS